MASSVDSARSASTSNVSTASRSVVARRLASIAVVALAFAVAWALRAQRAIALSVAAAALAALAMGVATTLRQPSLAFTFAHNACAALLIASLATAAARRA